jgi:type II secretory pathway pseudopilin PulG
VLDLLLVVIGIFLTLLVGVLAKYTWQFRRARKEYEKARNAVQDIVLSFNRQFQRVGERLELVAYKVEAGTSRNDRALEKATNVEKHLAVLESKITAISEGREGAASRLDEIDRRVRDIITSQEVFTAKISSIEEQMKQFATPPEVNVQTVIPIKRDRALAPLTETELVALKLLTSEGPKTAPEIKERISLSREHTARLMKKLYEEGYLERDPTKIPFKYSVKKEMKELLKKTETGGQ